MRKENTMRLIEKIKRPIFAMVLASCLVGGAAMAMEYCTTSSCEPVTCVTPAVCGATCPGNPSLEALRRTNLPGFYSNDYDYRDSAHNPNGIDYLIPTQAGLIESKVIPLTNPVDRYYATHTVRSGQVVDESTQYQLALSTPSHINTDGTPGGLATASESFGLGDAATEEMAYLYPTQTWE